MTHAASLSGNQGLRENGLEYKIEGHRVVKGLCIEKLVQLFEKALDGLAILEKTYKSEVKDRGVKEIKEQYRREIQTLIASQKKEANEKPTIFASVSDEEDYSEGLFASSEDFKTSSDVEEKEGVAVNAVVVPVENLPEEESQTAVDEEVIEGDPKENADTTLRREDSNELVEDEGIVEKTGEESAAELLVNEEKSDICSGEGIVVQKETQDSDYVAEPPLGQLMMEDLAELADETTKVYRNVVNGAASAFVSVLDWFADPVEETSESTDLD